MTRIAVIFESSPFDRKGLFNAVHNRIRHLCASGRCEVDAYCIHSWDTAFTRKVRHTPYVPKKHETVVVDDITYRMLWYDFSVIDHVSVEKLRLRPLLFRRFIRRTAELLRDYDCIAAHAFPGALVGYEVNRLYGKPYYVTWHGSDIHTHPFRNSLIMKDTRVVMEAASYNFFVSGALKRHSDMITSDALKAVLYNGVSDAFVRYADSERKALRERYGLSSEDKVVAYAGSMSAIKNVTMLQPIFHEVRKLYDGPLKFWIIGDGKIRRTVGSSVADDGSIDVRMWGNMPADEMPAMMNCIDVLVLPSRNEGLGMVCAEALRCGASAVGSAVGGITEVIGDDSVVPLLPAETFVKRFAAKVNERLSFPNEYHVPSELSWEVTASRELELMGLSE